MGIIKLICLCVTIVVLFFVTIELSSLLDSSLPAAVRIHFLLVVSFAACGGKAHKQQNGREVLKSYSFAQVKH